jgi:hypothetical protein
MLIFQALLFHHPVQKHHFENNGHKSENLENSLVSTREVIPLHRIIIRRQLEDIFYYQAVRIAD